LSTGEPSFIQYFLAFTERWLELTISKMDDDHLIHIFTDVTPIKESQLQLEKTVEELKRSNQNLEDLRTPHPMILRTCSQGAPVLQHAEAEL
jgi:hypothetical protein